MALAWKAGWVNSPQGFESPILRHADQRRRRDGLDEPDPAFGLWSRFSSRYRGDDRPGHPLDAETPSKAGWGTSPRFDFSVVAEKRSPLPQWGGANETHSEECTQAGSSHTSKPKVRMTTGEQFELDVRYELKCV